MSHGGKLDAVGNSLWPQLWAGNPMPSFVIACASSWLYGLHILPHTLYRMLQIYINTPEKVEQLGWFIQAVRSKIIFFFFFITFSVWIIMFLSVCTSPSGEEKPQLQVQLCPQISFLTTVTEQRGGSSWAEMPQVPALKDWLWYRTCL